MSCDDGEKMIKIKQLLLKFSEKEDIETLKKLLEAIVDKLEELEDQIADLDVALSYVEVRE
ncbi:MAG: hypothetical protein QXG39_08575 [Candidatus Aenigmatarchaeota archaeon]